MAPSRSVTVPAAPQKLTLYQGVVSSKGHDVHFRNVLLLVSRQVNYWQYLLLLTNEANIAGLRPQYQWSDLLHSHVALTQDRVRLRLVSVVRFISWPSLISKLTLDGVVHNYWCCAEEAFKEHIWNGHRLRKFRVTLQCFRTQKDKMWRWWQTHYVTMGLTPLIKKLLMKWASVVQVCGRFPYGVKSCPCPWSDLSYWPSLLFQLAIVSVAPFKQK